MSKYLNLKPIDIEKMGRAQRKAFKWEGRFLMPKFDGCFAMVCFWDGKWDFILSREGKEVTSMRHVFDNLLEQYDWLDRTPKGVAFLGEAWSPNMEFKKISGLFRRDANQPELGFVPFDVVEYTIDENNMPVLGSNEPYRKRLQKLGIKPTVCQGQAHAETYAAALKRHGGYDGAVVSDPEATYTPGSGVCGSFIKVKPVQSFDCKVLAVEAGEGAVTGRTTAVLVVSFKGCNQRVGTGFTPDEAAEWVANPSLVVGRTVEVECMGVYDGPTGLMREPRMKGFRDDVQ